MGSRFVWQLAGLCFIIGGLFGKFGAVLAIVPDPIIGGIMLIGYSMVFSVAISNLQVQLSFHCPSTFQITWLMQ